MNTVKKRKVILVDDHPLIRQAISEFINREADLEMCGEAESVEQACEVVNKQNPDAVIVDLSLKGVSGFELLKYIKESHPDVKVLVFSMHDESTYAERALKAGARGYMTKQEAPEQVIVALRKILAGQIYMSDTLASSVLEHVASGKGLDHMMFPMESLSNREFEVFRMMGQGMGSRQIAETLHLSIKTIETYREHIKEKIGVKSASELVQHAVQWTEAHEAA